MKINSAMVLCITLSFYQQGSCWDSDKDGIPNKYDECRKIKEDFDNFEDTDGCPDLDNDKDGVPDTRDKCPDKAEDLDGFEDVNGCPDPDNDQDGIPDSKDKCPNQAEDFDSFEDADGCKDTDNDKDGVSDDKDKCPNAKEDRDGFEDDNGCPDLDNDNDGIKDEVDKCPNQAENINNMEDEDGCPDVGELPIEGSKSYPEVKFRTGTDELTFESFRSLDALARKLVAYKDKQIKILVFKPFAINEKTSLDILAAQHKALVEYLISKGASPNQLAPGDFSPEAYQKVKDSDKDFNQEKPVEIHLTSFTPGPGSVPESSPLPTADSVINAAPHDTVK
ncbi:thrombospondin type 3 repeat-containing protein [Fibrobacterota bacterium]